MDDTEFRIKSQLEFIKNHAKREAYKKRAMEEFIKYRRKNSPSKFVLFLRNLRELITNPTGLMR